MSNLGYVRNDLNKVSDATLTPSSASSTYPVTNIATLPVSMPWRATGDTSENVLFDLGSAQSISFIGVIAHNLSAAATITVQAGTTSGTSNFSTTIPWRQYDAFKILSSAENYRYWKLIFTDSANVDTYIEIGYVILGTATELAFNYAYGWEFEDDFQNLIVESEMGAPHVARLFSRVGIRLNFTNISAANAATLRALFRALEGTVVPIFLIPDFSVNDGYFGRIVSSFNRTIDFYQSVSIAFVEDSRGKKLAA